MSGPRVTEAVQARYRLWPQTAERAGQGGDELLAFSATPVEELWSRTSSTNPLERLIKEVKRRTSAVGESPDRASVLAWWEPFRPRLPMGD
jgi:transposase-like protein